MNPSSNTVVPIVASSSDRRDLHRHTDEPNEAQQQQDGNILQRRIRIGMNASWAVNVILLASKIAIFIASRSYSVLASTVDSFVDLLSQVLVAMAEYKAKRWDPSYPTGRSRLETVAVIGCAMVMATCSVLVIRECIETIVHTTSTGDLPTLDLGPVVYTILGVATALKAALWIYCGRLKKHSPAMLALAEDHFNDVLSNGIAIGSASIAFYVRKVWWIDSAAGMVVSLYIMWSWWGICKEQIGHIVGIAAPEEFVAEVLELANEHHVGMQVDRIQAYHFGQRYVVELEVIMPADTVLKVTHDTALELQHKVEALETVERAYVHVDYEPRDLLEHKIERNLTSGVEDITMGYHFGDDVNNHMGLRHREAAVDRNDGGPSSAV